MLHPRPVNSRNRKFIWLTLAALTFSFALAAYHSASTLKVTAQKISSAEGQSVVNAAIADSFAIETIVNDDPPGGKFRFKLSDPNYNAAFEGTSKVMTVERYGDISLATQPVTVDYATVDGVSPDLRDDYCRPSHSTVVPEPAWPRCDYNTAIGTLTFAPGETIKTFKIFITRDAYNYEVEYFDIVLSNPTGGSSLDTPSTARIWIEDSNSVITALNPIDDTTVFVEQHYHDFLNRDADAPGLNFWTDNINKCHDSAQRPIGQTAAQCIDKQRESTSAAFFLSPEFQYTGGFVYQFYKGSLTGQPNYDNGSPGRFPTFLEFVKDMTAVSEGIIVNNQLSASRLEANRARFASDFVNRSEFKARYDGLPNDAYVQGLFNVTGIVPTDAERQQLIDGLNNQTETKATVLRKVVDGTRVMAEGQEETLTRYGKAFRDQEFRRKFVLMAYFGYLQRDPDAAGFNHWLQKLNDFNGDYFKAEMVRAFIISVEYRRRFGDPY